MRLSSDNLRLSGQGSLQQQLYTALRQQLLAGHWPHLALLPSSRSLALDLAISRNTVNSALAQLVAEGYLQPLAGRGYQICAQLPDLQLQADISTASQNAATALAESCTALYQQLPNYPMRAKAPPKTGCLQPGVPDLNAFPFGLWQKLSARHQSRLSLAGSIDAQGYLPLRQALALHLQQARQVRVSPDNLVITQGAQQALYLASKLLCRNGDQVWMESPGYPRLRQALQLSDLAIRYIPASAHNGPDLSALPQHGEAKVLFVSPAHQYPLGAIMPMAQRLALLDWARAQHCWLVEDDYDAEFQFAHRPIASLQGLAGGAPVLLAGSFSKTLFPALRLGYLVLPDALVARANALLQAIQGDVTALPQAVLADFIQEGHYQRHLRKMRRIYKERQQQALQLLAEHLPDWPVHATAAGLHLVLMFPAAVEATFDTSLDSSLDASLAGSSNTVLNDQLFSLALQQQGFLVQPLSRYHFCGETAPGLVIGFANATLAQLQSAVLAIVRQYKLCR